MTTRVHDPRRLDVAVAAADAASLTGTWPLAAFERLTERAPSPGDVAWSAQFGQCTVSGAHPERELRLRATALVQRDCQRCLQAVTLDLSIDRLFRFAADEATAAALDADSDDDVLALSRQFDLMSLLEDELLLALPLVPKHARCPHPLPQPLPAAEAADEAAPVHPFAALAALKRGPGV